MFTKRQISLLDAALELAIDNVEDYLRHGNPEDDLPRAGYQEVTYLPEEWRELRQLISGEHYET